jgi:hypothetical protein
MAFRRDEVEVNLTTSRDEFTYGMVVIDDNPAARRIAVLSQALADAQRANSRAVPGRVEATDLYTYGQPEIEAVVARFSRSSVFVVVNEERLSELTGGKAVPRVPSQSIAYGYELMSKFGTNVDVYFVVRRNAGGLDVISMLLSGARGVIDSEVLGSSALISIVLKGLAEPATETRILAGRAAQVLDSFVQLVRSKYRMAKHHFALLVALAEIPLMRLNITDRVTQKEVVNQLQRHFDETGYEVKLDTYRLLPTVLTIVKETISDDYEEDVSECGDENLEDNSRLILSKSERPELAFLPSYARHFGLPAQVLPVRGINQADLIKHLYKRGLYGVETLGALQFEGVQISQVTFPPGEGDRQKRKRRRRAR